MMMMMMMMMNWPKFGWPARNRHTAACVHRFSHILRWPPKPVVWFMSESREVANEHEGYKRTLPIISSSFWMAVSLRGLSFKCKNNLAPVYLSELMKSYVPIRALRSSGANLMVVRRVNTELARGSFSSASYEVWNSLPPTPSIRSLESNTMFKRQLKTFLFNLW